MPRINIADSRPATRQVAEHYAALIRSGELPTGEQLPAKSEMSTEWGVSTETVRGAMDLLRSAGLVISRRGVGVFVAGAEPITFTLTHERAGDTELAVSDTPTPEAATALSLAADDPVHTTTVLDHAGTDRVLSRTVTTYLGPAGTYRPQAADSTYRLQARVPTQAEARDMNLPMTTPVLVRERIDHGPAGPIAHAVTTYYGPVTRLEHRD